MRHASRTHRVALDWLFDRVNLDPKIQIEKVNTKNQLADILTEGSFSRCILVSISVIFLSDDQGWKAGRHVKKRSKDDFERRLSDGESETMPGAARAQE